MLSVIGTPPSSWKVGHFPRAEFWLAGAFLLEPPWGCAFRFWSLSCSYFGMSVTPAACPLSAGVYCPRAGVTGCVWSFSAVTVQSVVVFFSHWKSVQRAMNGLVVWLLIVSPGRAQASSRAVGWQRWDAEHEAHRSSQSFWFKPQSSGLCKLACYCVVPEQTYT